MGDIIALDERSGKHDVSRIFDRTFARRMMQVLLFPLMLGSMLALAWTLGRRGVSPSSTLGIVSVTTIVVVALCERLLPFRPDWNRARGDVATDALHSFFSSYLVPEGFKLLLLLLLLPAAIALSRALGHEAWPAHWPVALQVALAAVIAEFGSYWLHRLGHETRPLWRLHAVHHSPERLYWLNAGREHPLGAIVINTLPVAPLIALGCTAECLTLYFALQAVHGLFQHANIDVRLGPLNWVFSMAELHRWHHSERVEEANHNYGLTLILWDVVFGTRFLPDLRGPSTLGIPDMPLFPKDFLHQLTVPFNWNRWAAPSTANDPD